MKEVGHGIMVFSRKCQETLAPFTGSLTGVACTGAIRLGDRWLPRGGALFSHQRSWRVHEPRAMRRFGQRKGVGFWDVFGEEFFRFV